MRPGLSCMVAVPLTWTFTILYGPLVLMPNFLGFHFFLKHHLLGSIIIAPFFWISLMRFSWIRCSLLCVMACQSAINGMLRNMSLLKTRLPGLLPKVECTPILMPCMVINDIPYIFFCISNLSPYILYWQRVPICLAMCSHIFGNMSPYIWQYVPIYLAICPHIFCTVSPYNLSLEYFLL